MSAMIYSGEIVQGVIDDDDLEAFAFLDDVHEKKAEKSPKSRQQEIVKLLAASVFHELAKAKTSPLSSPQLIEKPPDLPTSEPGEIVSSVVEEKCSENICEELDEKPKIFDCGNFPNGSTERSSRFFKLEDEIQDVKSLKKESEKGKEPRKVPKRKQSKIFDYKCQDSGHDDSDDSVISDEMVKKLHVAKTPPFESNSLYTLLVKQQEGLEHKKAFKPKTPPPPSLKKVPQVQDITSKTAALPSIKTESSKRLPPFRISSRISQYSNLKVRVGKKFKKKNQKKLKAAKQWPKIAFVRPQHGPECLSMENGLGPNSGLVVSGKPNVPRRPITISFRRAVSPPRFAAKTKISDADNGKSRKPIESCFASRPVLSRINTDLPPPDESVSLGPSKCGSDISKTIRELGESIVLSRSVISLPKKKRDLATFAVKEMKESIGVSMSVLRLLQSGGGGDRGGKATTSPQEEPKGAGPHSGGETGEEFNIPSLDVVEPLPSSSPKSTVDGLSDSLSPQSATKRGKTDKKSLRSTSRGRSRSASKKRSRPSSKQRCTSSNSPSRSHQKTSKPCLPRLSRKTSLPKTRSSSRSSSRTRSRSKYRPTTWSRSRSLSRTRSRSKSRLRTRTLSRSRSRSKYRPSTSSRSRSLSRTRSRSKSRLRTRTLSRSRSRSNSLNRRSKRWGSRRNRISRRSPVRGSKSKDRRRGLSPRCATRSLSRSLHNKKRRSSSRRYRNRSRQRSLSSRSLSPIPKQKTSQPALTSGNVSSLFASATTDVIPPGSQLTTKLAHPTLPVGPTITSGPTGPSGPVFPPTSNNFVNVPNKGELPSWQPNMAPYPFQCPTYAVQSYRSYYYGAPPFPRQPYLPRPFIENFGPPWENPMVPVIGYRPHCNPLHSLPNSFRPPSWLSPWPVQATCNSDILASSFPKEDPPPGSHNIVLTGQLARPPPFQPIVRRKDISKDVLDIYSDFIESTDDKNDKLTEKCDKSVDLKPSTEVDAIGSPTVWNGDKQVMGKKPKRNKIVIKLLWNKKGKKDNEGKKCDSSSIDLKDMSAVDGDNIIEVPGEQGLHKEESEKQKVDLCLPCEADVLQLVNSEVEKPSTSSGGTNVEDKQVRETPADILLRLRNILLLPKRSVTTQVDFLDMSLQGSVETFDPPDNQEYVVLLNALRDALR